MNVVTPSVPRVPGPPWLGPARGFLRDPTTFLSDARARYGDTFLVEVCGYQMLFVFSPVGLRSLYALAEEDASFTQATKALIGLRLPPELLTADMEMFQHVFTGVFTNAFDDHIADAVNEELATLGTSGELEVFSRMRTLVHRIGFRCWAGPEATAEPYFSQLVRCFDRIDPEDVFLHPGRTSLAVLTRKAPERRALRQAADLLGEIWRTRQRLGVVVGDNLDALHALYADRTEEQRNWRVARDVIVLHLASQTNLYAALSWTIVQLARRPADVERILTDDPDRRYLDQCASEAIRLGQRSLTLRKVLRPCEVSDGTRTYTVAPGAFVATMLSVTNPTAAPGLADYDPNHYERARLAKDVGVETREQVSTFGHAVHACPGQRFALAAIRRTVLELFGSFEVTPRFTEVRPQARQIGAVARADRPCVVGYQRRSGVAPLGVFGGHEHPPDQRAEQTTDQREHDEHPKLLERPRSLEDGRGEAASGVHRRVVDGDRDEVHDGQHEPDREAGHTDRHRLPTRARDHEHEQCREHDLDECHRAEPESAGDGTAVRDRRLVNAIRSHSRRSP